MKNTWIRVSDRLPDKEEFYWCWNENKPENPPEILEAWTRDGVGKGFCLESCGFVPGVTHWAVIVPPPLPEKS